MKEVKKVLITGGNGFLGRNLVDYFKARGYEVSVLVRDIKRYPFREKGVRVFE